MLKVFDLAGPIQWGRRICISKKLPCDADIFSLEDHTLRTTDIRLHWLITLYFKILLSLFKTFQGLAPVYFSNFNFLYGSFLLYLC